MKKRLNIIQTIKNFDNFLENKNELFEAIIIGGAALNLLSIVDRATKDMNVIIPEELPKKILAYSKEFAEKNDIPLDWLNTGPESITKELPPGWNERLKEAYSGSNLKLKTLGRTDLIKTKAWAYVDRGTDKEDLIAMKPSLLEIIEAKNWVKDRDGNPDWPKYVDIQMKLISEEIKKEKAKDKGIE